MVTENFRMNGFGPPVNYLSQLVKEIIRIPFSNSYESNILDCLPGPKPDYWDIIAYPRIKEKHDSPGQYMIPFVPG